jgi:hypothetical protein
MTVTAIDIHTCSEAACILSDAIGNPDLGHAQVRHHTVVLIIRPVTLVSARWGCDWRTTESRRADAGAVSTKWAEFDVIELAVTCTSFFKIKSY